MTVVCDVPCNLIACGGSDARKSCEGVRMPAQVGPHDCELPPKLATAGEAIFANNSDALEALKTHDCTWGKVLSWPLSPGDGDGA